jgi:hypothetical protein
VSRDVNRLLSDVDAAVREGIGALDSLESWIREHHGSLDQREYAAGRRWQLEQGQRAVQDLRQLAADTLKGRPVVMACDHDAPAEDPRCTCQDPGARPPCNYCTDGPDPDDVATPAAVQWCVFAGGPDPDNAALTRMYDDEADAREDMQWFTVEHGRGLARRDVVASAWTVTTIDGPVTNGADATESEGAVR